MSKTERRPRLTTARKFELYLATRSADAPLGEILRQYGVHLDDLRAIERVVESSALAGLKAQSRHGRGELVNRCRLFYGGSFRPHPRVTRIIGYIR